MASKPFYSVADRILGSKFLEDIAEFFLLFQTMYDGLRRAGQGRHPHARGQAHDLRGGVHARVGAGARGRVLRRRARRPRPPPRRGRAQQGAARAGSSTREPPAPPRRCAPRSDELAAALPDVDRRAGAGRPGAPRGGGELPQLPGGGQAGGGDARRAERRARGGRGGAVLRPRHHRPGRAARTSASRSGGDAAAPVAVASGHPATTAAADRGARAPAATPSTRAWRPASRRPSPSRRSPASAAVGSSWPARAAGEEVLFDFFVDTPGRGPAADGAPLDFDEVVVRFSGAEQAFHVGLGSVAVPGLPGRAGCTPTGGSGGSPLDGRHRARPGGSPREGVEVNDQQAYVLAHPRADPHPHPGGGRDRRRRAAGCSARATGSPTRRWPAFLGELDERGLRRARAWPAAIERRHGRRAVACVTAADLDGLRGRRARAAGGAVARPPAAHQPAAGVRRRAGRARPPRARGPARVAGRAPGPSAHAVALAEAMIATDEVRAAGRVGERAPPPVDRRHHPRQRRRRRGRRRVDDDVERRGVGLAAPGHRRDGQQHDGGGRPPPRRLPRHAARASGWRR